MIYPDIIVMGSYLVDMVARVDELPRPEESKIVKSLTKLPGGKGSNQSIAVAYMGGKVALISAVGEDTEGIDAQKLWQQSQVDKSLVKIVPDAGTGQCLITVDTTGRSTFAAYLGALEKVNLKYIEEQKSFIEHSKVFVCSSTDFSVEVNQTALSLANSAKSITIYRNQPIQNLPTGFLESVQILIGNALEIEHLSGKNILDERGNVTDLEDVKNAGREILKLGPKTVIVTIGARGFILISEKIAWHIPNYPGGAPVDFARVIDALTGALAVGLAEQFEYEKIIKYMKAAATLSASKRQDSHITRKIPNRTEIEDIVEKYHAITPYIAI